MNRWIVAWAAGLGFLGVALGAMGAHLLAATLEGTGRSSTFETAAQYHLVHALALLAVGLHGSSLRGARFVGLAWILGVILFSGSLYTLSLTNLTVLGAVAPLGGASLMIGWLILLFSVLRQGGAGAG